MTDRLLRLALALTLAETTALALPILGRAIAQAACDASGRCTSHAEGF